MDSIKVDKLNTLLILISFIAAFYFPFELFILVYAFLGPLHYLTEINWIKDRNYFTRSKTWAIGMIIFSIIISIPFLLSLAGIHREKGSMLYRLERHSVILLPVAFLVAFLLLSSFSKKMKLGLLAIGLLLMILVRTLPFYKIVAGLFLPTIIHVYFFTMLFMWYGVLKSGSQIGKLNIVLLIVLPILLFFIGIDSSLYNSRNVFQEIFLQTRFHILNSRISQVLGMTDGKHFSFFETLYIKIQIFISFAYTYHYLNWFSKTTIIGWHKNITTKKSIIILVVWVCSFVLYLYNYKAGYAVILFLSILHVFMEFPLNIITIKGIIHSLGERKKQSA